MQSSISIRNGGEKIWYVMENALNVNNVITKENLAV
jgi:hypothetical protein